MDLTCNQAVTLLRAYRGDRFNPAYEIGTYETDVQHLVAHGLLNRGRDGHPTSTSREYITPTNAGHALVKHILTIRPPAVQNWSDWSKRALRQFSHNDSSGLVFGYDKYTIDQMMSYLVVPVGPPTRRSPGGLTEEIIESRAKEARIIVEPDERSPAVGEGGEHTTLYAYVNGNYDIGKIKLDGFTLISNNDLAMYKAGQPVAPVVPPAPALTGQQVRRLRQLVNRYSQAKVAESWAGAADPADAAALKTDAVNAKRILQNFIRKLGGIENVDAADDASWLD